MKHLMCWANLKLLQRRVDLSSKFTVVFLLFALRAALAGVDAQATRVKFWTLWLGAQRTLICAQAWAGGGSRGEFLPNGEHKTLFHPCSLSPYNRGTHTHRSHPERCWPLPLAPLRFAWVILAHPRLQGSLPCSLDPRLNELKLGLVLLELDLFPPLIPSNSRLLSSSKRCFAPGLSAPSLAWVRTRPKRSFSPPSGTDTMGLPRALVYKNQLTKISPVVMAAEWSISLLSTSKNYGTAPGLTLHPQITGRVYYSRSIVISVKETKSSAPWTGAMQFIMVHSVPPGKYCIYEFGSCNYDMFKWLWLDHYGAILI